MVKNTQADRIQQLEDMMQLLQEKVNTQNTALENLTRELRDATDIIKQLINDTDTKITIEAARRERDIQLVKTASQDNASTRASNIELTMPTFSGEPSEHPKQFLKNLNSYLLHKHITQVDRIITIENCMRGKAAKWFTMIKDLAPNEDTFKTLFLKHFFSEDRQWDIFIKCTEAGKKPISNNFQEHFHYWMTELKHLDSPKMDELQAINLITKHFPIAIQAYIQTTQEKKFLNIWEKLGELENNYNKQNNTDQQITNNKQPFTSRYTRTNDNQTQPFTSRYGNTNGNNSQQVRDRYAHTGSIQQNSTQQSGLRQSAHGTSGQTQYTSAQDTKTIRCLVTHDDTNDESANEEGEANIIDDDTKNLYGEAMVMEDQ
ncbi:unnamed protein product [Macrosiphum euphorbiae]|uniref:Retrotransposon gag domain-containing protein n=1 Tax=Macrosiphum euphorbiae TaxID=13131 RepID=A0AAV0VYB8_9HEMI|nr:unnamed protein product [Macrosiphum euphorbiae]